MKRRSRLSPKGRLRCSETGRTNVVAWNMKRDAVRRELAALAQETREGLLREIGQAPTQAQRILIESAVASALALRTISSRLMLARATPALLGDLIRLQGQTSRTLRGIGVDLHGAESEAEPSGALAEYLAERTAKRHESD